MTEKLLQEALRALTDPIIGDPASRSRLAAELGRPTFHRTWPLVATAASVAGVAVASSLLLSGSGASSPQAPRPLSSAGTTLAAAPPVSTTPLTPTTDFPAYRGDDIVFVRAATGRVVGTLEGTAHTLFDPILSPDGKTVYIVGNEAKDLLGIDVATGQHQVLSHHAGQIGGVTVSADGSTLAYEWIPNRNGDLTNISVVLRDLKTGAERLLPNAPGGPQYLSMALSPDGSQLAVATTSQPAHSLVIVPTDAGFSQGRTLTKAACSTGPIGTVDQPRWTPTALYVVQHCIPPTQPRAGSDIARVDPQTGTSELLHAFPAANTFFMTPVGNLFVTSDESTGDAHDVIVRNPAHDWVGTTVHGLRGLAVSGSE
jgi:hypothetical protein